MTPIPHPSFTALHTIDWNDCASILSGCTPVFDALTTDGGLLSELLDQLTGEHRLAQLCEGYDFMRKLILYDDPDHGIRLRLHLYRGGFFDRPHNHRWSFASRILRGGYTHRIFGNDSEFDETTDPARLRPLLQQRQEPGSSYALHHTSVHTVHADHDTISLLMRGPAAKYRFLIHDTTRGFFWAHGAAQEPPEQRAAKRLTPNQLADTTRTVRRLLIDCPVEAR
ncbi:hypothetical protein OH799_11515 [Nocardia sp. NBC_00881]|uniref:hypothetical protein n=1 Tax=Nocardia sp. NBC_00881 TaxID=2975995 RepID=UPI00386A4C25|nr:hypothetical protein OH799_11515 [Nocardia sp. NBC_00881]